MASSTTSDRQPRSRTGGKSGGQAGSSDQSEQERLQARATEMDLIREAQAGSRAAFDTLVRQYEHQVLRLALHLTGTEQDAEDI
jgi:RNA polymerase sigma-70 factor (ECF subfamily)